MDAPKPKRVLVFTLAYFPFVGGAEISIDEMTKRLPEFECELITARLDPSLPKQETVGNVLVHRVGFGANIDKMLLPILGTYKALRIIAARPVDVFWGVMVTYASGIPYIVNILRPWRRVPVVLTLEEGDSREHIESKQFGFGGFLWRLAMLPALLAMPRSGARATRGIIARSWRLALPRTDIVVAISGYLASLAREYGYRGRLETIPIGVDVARFSRRPPREEIDALKRRFQKKPGETYLITASRLVGKNAVDDIIRALVRLPKNVKLLVAGDGPDGEALWRLARELGVEQRALFLGAYTHDELVKYLAVSDVFVRPSRSEGQGIAFLEAFAAGVPVVATPVGGIVDFLFDPDGRGASNTAGLGTITPTGVFAEPNDPESVARAVKRVLHDDALRARIVKNALALVRAKYDWKHIARAMRERVFAQLLGG